MEELTWVFSMVCAFVMCSIRFLTYVCMGTDSRMRSGSILATGWRSTDMIKLGRGYGYAEFGKWWEEVDFEGEAVGEEDVEYEDEEISGSIFHFQLSMRSKA